MSTMSDGPDRTNTYRTELCRFWWSQYSSAKRHCWYAARGLACPFAHDPDELQHRSNHNERCRHSAVYRGFEEPLADEHWILEVREHHQTVDQIEEALARVQQKVEAAKQLRREAVELMTQAKKMRSETRAVSGGAAGASRIDLGKKGHVWEV